MDDRPPAPEASDRLEFFRHGVALMSDPEERFPAIAYDVTAANGTQPYRFCTCQSARKRTCDHLKTLSRLKHDFLVRVGTDPEACFLDGYWHRLAACLGDGSRETLGTLWLTASREHGPDGPLVIADRDRTPLVIYYSQGPDRRRLLERCTLSAGEDTVPTRADVLRHLALMTMNETERVLRDKGLKTARQTLEEKFWYRFAYHCFREFGREDGVLHPGVDEAGGEFYLNARDREDRLLFRLPVPRTKVKHLLMELKQGLRNGHGFEIQPLCLDALFDVRLNEGMDLEIEPLLRLIQRSGEHLFFKREDLKRFQYGDLYYIKELGMMVEDRYPAAAPKLDEPMARVVHRSQVPLFLAEHEALLQQDLFRLDSGVQALKIVTAFDQIEIYSLALEREWCWLAATYGDGSQSVRLEDILAAKRAGERFVAMDNGWVDCRAPQFELLDELVERPVRASTEKAQGVRLSRAALFRLCATAGQGRVVTGAGPQAEALNNLLALRPSTPMPPIQGMTSSLRAYQHTGVEWLWFLYEHGFGGLLCDDMGLGKTHQIMAFLLVLRQAGLIRKPCLVVCPTSVLSHWERKLAVHAPGLMAAVHHGGGRDLGAALARADVLITSYGLLRRESAALGAVNFGLAVFDEVQHIKNADTQAHQAAQAIRAGMKIGLTGTPIENRLDDLRALMDLVVPGYLGIQRRFIEYFQIPIVQNQDDTRRRTLTRLIAPFTLRRLKKSVLAELPAKIEDVRACRLSEEQVQLYRDAIRRRGAKLRAVLAQGDAQIPYLHIFALLNLLKQICNHPAQAARKPEAYARHASGKWELFTELLTESLESGQKVVVYSQYAGMIDIITRYLADQKIDFVSLTGKTRDRGRCIARFDEDPACRVFVGSLKAGGVGIDLVAASVVIHYDRWWNAAREDQATDRVHRIGQRRGVQVFKLVTEGTLEEKITAIIARKRDLADLVVPEDDPAQVKLFSRQELLELLAMPDKSAAD